MQTMTRESWTDERLDDLNGRVSEGFQRVDQRFERVEERLDSIQRLIAFGAIAMSGSFLAGFAALASQL